MFSPCLYGILAIPRSVRFHFLTPEACDSLSTVITTVPSVWSGGAVRASHQQCCEHEQVYNLHVTRTPFHKRTAAGPKHRDDFVSYRSSDGSLKIKINQRVCSSRHDVLLLRTARDLRRLVRSSLAIKRFFMFSCSSWAGAASVALEMGAGLSWVMDDGTAPENFSICESRSIVS